MEAAAAPEIAVIGRCAVASCHRPASRHIVLSVPGHTLIGTLCEHCERASRMALFLLELDAA